MTRNDLTSALPTQGQYLPFPLFFYQLGTTSRAREGTLLIVLKSGTFEVGRLTRGEVDGARLMGREVFPRRKERIFDTN